MKKSSGMSKRLAVLAVALLAGVAGARDVTIIEKGVAKCAIYAPSGLMEADAAIPGIQPWLAKENERQRRLARDSVKDLALYLEKMSGAKVEILTQPPAKDDTRLPILIGEAAVRKFGAPRASYPYKQGFRVVVSPKGIGLAGESDLAVSYAIYELLESLGCRWYMPSEMGEIIPARPTVKLPGRDESLAPGTIYRGIWYGDEAFKRRTRQGGLVLSAGHALEIAGYIPKEKLAAHPEWQGLIKGKREPSRFCWSNPEVAAAVADGIIAMLDKDYSPTVSLSPDDGALFCECDKCKALDAGDWDVSLGEMSITDRYIHFCNQIAGRVTAKYPDVLFGFLAYVQYTRPPVRETLHPNLVPQIAPITYCRAHTTLQGDLCPSRHEIKPIVEGWGKKAHRLSYYNYMFHLAEVSVPYPMIRQMSDELSILYANHVAFWQPESLSNFESVLPGMVLAMRMSWNPKAAPATVLDEFYGTFYGAAAPAMRRYWQTMDEAWTQVPEHAGSGFGHMRRFTPARMGEARAAMDDALAAAKTASEHFRVAMQDEALRQFELFMKLRHDLADGRFTGLGADAARWMEKQLALGRDYAPQSAFTKVGWTPLTVAGTYFSSFFKPAYDDAARLAKDYVVVSPPLRQWRYQVDKEKKGESRGWQESGFDDTAWSTTDPCVDTWASLGLTTYYGPVFYRATVKLPTVPAGKKVYLWIGGTDGSAKVYVNGRHIPYVSAKGETSDAFSGYCQPASFDITPAVKRGDENTVAIIGTHQVMNELGTGGLIAPVVVYHEK